MANAHIIFGKTKRDSILDSNFTSVTVTSGNTSTASPAEASIASITAVGGDIYVALSVGIPNAAVHPRALIMQNGTADFSISNATKIAVLDA